MKDILDRSAGERPNEHLKTLDDAIRCVAEAADGIKAGCAAGDEWPDANDKQYYDAQVDCLTRLRSMRAALARASEAAWRTGEPPVAEGKAEEFIVAVRRKTAGNRVFVFSATYANQFTDDGCLSGRDGDEYIANGWHLVGLDTSGEFDQVYEAIALGEGDEIVGWQPLPKWGDEAVARASEAAVGEPVAWMYKQGDYLEPSLLPLEDEALARGWTQRPLVYAAPQAASEPESSCDPADICAGCRCKYNTYAQPASEQQAIDLAAALEQQRALAIVAAVRAQGFAKSNSDLPTQAESVFDLACEEIEHRLRTEVWALDGMPAPLPGGQQAARGMSDAARRRLEFYSAGYCKSTNKTDREAGKALRTLLARPNETVALSNDAIKRAIAAWFDDHGFAEDFERRMRNAIRAAGAASQAAGTATEQAKADRDLLLYGESFTVDGKRVPPERVRLQRAPSVKAADIGLTMSHAVRDVLAERRRVVEQEGFTPEHDDEHDPGDLAAAACAYALAAADKLNPHSQSDGNYERDKPPVMWPESWCSTWWKPSTPRRDLVKATQLIIAEIERLDRAGIDPKQQ